MTLLEIFNKVEAHLLAQGVKSIAHHRCAYRCNDGTACAVGCLITDENYDKELENNPISSKRLRLALAASGITTDHETITMLGRLLDVHDSFETRRWSKELSLLREKYFGETK